MQGGQGENGFYGSAGSDGERAEQLLIVIDDDELSRDVLTLIARDGGFCVESFASGEDALNALATAVAGRGQMTILTDLQMPGICGEALAEKLRGMVGSGTKLLAMSGSEPAAGMPSGYDAFLLKPFSADELKSACHERRMQAAADVVEAAGILDERVFEHFARSMAVSQVFALYRMCLDDSAKRVVAMRQAVDDGDDGAYRRAAHAIKGGCGMVGAIELARLAAAL
jgi:CheY-like chemotaxis protein